MTIPILYKYLDPAGAKALLSNLTFKFSPPNQLNDPFEFMPGGYTGDTLKERLRRQKDLLYTEKYRVHWNNKTGMHISGGDWKDFVNGFSDEQIGSLANCVFDALQERDWKPFVDKISESFGLSCFSAKENNILMWSHYADSHRGIVIGFNLNEYSPDLHEVKYLNDRIKIPLSSTCNDDEEKRKIMISVMTSKSKDWEYEKEWRLISKLPALNNNLYLIPFNSTIILSVFLGLNISEEDRKDITDLLKMIPEVRNISFFQMTPSHDKFELTANKIELA